MTGSLPTFIDMSRNFGSDELREDNLVQQLKRQNRSCVFMGDDTWISLLGDQFVIKYPFPSFNVMDLDTVDNGVKRHLVDEIKNQSSGWSLIVAHLLGLDHAGHRYNLNNAAIGSKLQEYDGVIKSVADAMDDDTLLVVMGDHGMTASGDHGGDTAAEVESALFLFSKSSSPLVNAAARSQTNSADAVSNCPFRLVTVSTAVAFVFVKQAVSQIDLVPTLSLLMGSPIPFSNLGAIIPHVFPTRTLLDEALDANIAQITRFINAEKSR